MHLKPILAGRTTSSLAEEIKHATCQQLWIVSEDIANL
jgi:hypothetical protein